MNLIQEVLRSDTGADVEALMSLLPTIGKILADEAEAVAGELVPRELVPLVVANRIRELCGVPTREMVPWQR